MRAGSTPQSEKKWGVRDVLPGDDDAALSCCTNVPNRAKPIEVFPRRSTSPAQSACRRRSPPLVLIVAAARPRCRRSSSAQRSALVLVTSSSSCRRPLVVRADSRGRHSALVLVAAARPLRLSAPNPWSALDLVLVVSVCRRPLAVRAESRGLCAALVLVAAAISSARCPLVVRAESRGRRSALVLVLCVCPRRIRGQRSISFLSSPFAAARSPSAPSLVASALRSFLSPPLSRPPAARSLSAPNPVASAACALVLVAAGSSFVALSRLRRLCARLHRARCVALPRRALAALVLSPTPRSSSSTAVVVRRAASTTTRLAPFFAARAAAGPQAAFGVLAHLVNPYPNDAPGDAYFLRRDSRAIRRAYQRKTISRNRYLAAAESADHPSVVSDDEIEIVHDPDVQMLDNGGRQASPATQLHLAYLARFSLVLPPFHQGHILNTARTNKVLNYLAQEPKIENHKTATVELLRRVFQQKKQDPDWARKLECTVCLAKEGTAKVILSCGCHDTIFHQGCVEAWHRQRDEECKKTLKCPTCDRHAKPINLEWATASEAELEICAKNDKARKKAAKKKKLQTNPEAKAKAQQKANRRFQSIRDRRAAAGQAGAGPSWLPSSHVSDPPASSPCARHFVRCVPLARPDVSSEEAFQQLQQTTLAAARAARDEAAAFHRVKQTALTAFRAAQDYNRRCRPQSRTRATAEVERCRRILISLSGALPPTSDDDELTSGPRGRRRICPSPPSSDDEYHSSSSSSSGGSSQRDLEEKEALCVDFFLRPADVIARFRAMEQNAAAVASTINAPQHHVHDPACRSLCHEMARCNCNLRKERLDRRRARREDRLRRWLAGMLREEGGNDAHVD
ncbi:hypothetical protein DFH06DRAFT_1327900 [Mycena polygramma]|nr:hypothetical protein DFH06DRAFT_1327900 [Mycena polygramma]